MRENPPLVRQARPSYISAMRKKLSNWRITRIRGNKAEQLGIVTAADEASAIKTAIKEHKISNPEKLKRLAARREDR
jgi:hypothetical protein